MQVDNAAAHKAMIRSAARGEKKAPVSYCALVRVSRAARQRLADGENTKDDSNSCGACEQDGHAAIGCKLGK